MEKDQEKTPKNVISLKLPKAKKLLINYELIPAGNKDVSVGKDVREIYTTLIELLGQELCAAEGQLFLVHDGALTTFETTDSFFGYVSGLGIQFDWCKNATCVTKKEFFSYCKMQAKQYGFISYIPMSPKAPNVFYAPTPETTLERGVALDQLVSMFSPASEFDRFMIKAALVTPFWGSRGGIRPAFVFDAEDDSDMGGRGVGKTKLTDIIGELTGGIVDLHIDSKIERAKERLLGADKERCARFDNVKALSVDCDWIEAIITAPFISGHRMYKGQKNRPNLYTYYFTFNGANMSKDLAQRVVLIKLRRPEYAALWVSHLNLFIEERRWDIIADAIDLIERPELGLPASTRFADWETAIAQKVCGRALDKLGDIAERQKSVDDDDTESQMIREMFEHNIAQYSRRSEFGTDLKLDPRINSLMIKNTLATEWLKTELGYKNLSAKMGAMKIKRARLPEIEPEMRKNDGYRYWVWNPAKLKGAYKIDTKGPCSAVVASDWVAFYSDSGGPAVNFVDSNGPSVDDEEFVPAWMVTEKFPVV